MRALLFIIVLAVGLLATRSQVHSWWDPDLGQAVHKGEADARHLWLLGQKSVVVRFDRQTGARTVVGRDVVDLLRDGTHLWAASKIEGATDVSIADLKAVGGPAFSVEIEGEFIGLFATRGDRPGLLTSRQVLRPTGDGWQSYPLVAELKCGGAPATYSQVASSADGGLYIGCDVGEWGGGLQRIDWETGSSAIISQTTGEECSGLLSPECDPVVGLFADPDQSNCMIVGSSLAHMTGREGRVLRVCGDTITEVFSEPLRSRNPEYPQSWAFDGLVPAHDGWVAYGQHRYARSRSGTVEMRRNPALADRSGPRISEEQDGVLFVMEGCCWGYIDHPTEFRVLAVPVEPFE
ncbi:MAG: hypothetical protein Q8R45_09560 [Brevundimonas sp.]|uniref:hypothetical protein n=1 Tax=Brevundimonas sp. TaxID=1871086 RepID=UPI002734F8A3|nr:hypothetical protein [Brevundimonas sp.]MDP3657197.1 hypothetical protein [Brevundimonas sp.]